MGCSLFLLRKQGNDKLVAKQFKQMPCVISKWNDKCMLSIKPLKATLNCKNSISLCSSLKKRLTTVNYVLIF